jgi:hypothetical protein
MQCGPESRLDFGKAHGQGLLHSKDHSHMVAWSLEDQEVGFTIFVKPPVWTMDMGLYKIHNNLTRNG